MSSCIFSTQQESRVIAYVIDDNQTGYFHSEACAWLFGVFFMPHSDGTECWGEQAPASSFPSGILKDRIQFLIRSVQKEKLLSHPIGTPSEADKTKADLKNQNNIKVTTWNMIAIHLGT